jgi:hypothetical protein
MGLDTKTYWLTDHQSQCDFDFDLLQLEYLVEAGSNTSAVALRVVGGDEKGTHCLGVKPGHPVVGEYKFGDLPSRLGDCRIWDSKMDHESRWTRTREWLGWREPVAIVNNRLILSSESMLQMDYNRKWPGGI